jgi:phage shock protein A
MDTEAVKKDLLKRDLLEKEVAVHKLVLANQKLIELVERLHTDNDELHDCLLRSKDTHARLENKIKELKVLLRTKNDIIGKLMDL